MDNKPTFNDSCSSMKSLMAVYTILEAAALWCGIKEQDLADVAANAVQISGTGIGRSIYKHPYISCIEPFTRAIAIAVDDRSLPHCRENGKLVGEHDAAAHLRRRITGVSLKKWMESTFPNDKPSFLFDDLERSTHTSISADAYQVVVAERDAQNIRLKNADTEYKKLQTINNELAKKASANIPITTTSRRNLDLLIGLLTKALADKSGPNCGNQDKPNYSGLSELLQQYLPTDGMGMPSSKALSSDSIRKKLSSGYDSLADH